MLSSREVAECGFLRWANSLDLVSGVSLDDKLGLEEHCAELILTRGGELYLALAFPDTIEPIAMVDDVNHLKTILELTDWPRLIEDVRKEV